MSVPKVVELWSPCGDTAWRETYAAAAMVRILIFDDDLVGHPEFLSGLSESLGADLELIYRAHADDAVAEAEALRPAAILMDYSMGADHVSGARAVSNLRERFDPSKLPIVGISSDARANELMRMAGANNACVKWVAPTELPRILKPLFGADG